MTFRKPDMEYWNRKLAAYMHDPLDKVFKIQGHENRAEMFLDKYGVSSAGFKYWKKADGISAGLERGQVPTYSSDPKKNGAVDFCKLPIITHPTSERASLSIDLSKEFDGQIDFISKELMEFIEKDIGMESGQKGYSEMFANDETRFAMARFFYNHLVLRFRLAENNVAGLGAFWHRIPADSRFPDHSIWQHNALCSALNSSIELANGNVSDTGIMVFSITPVQAFISKARKLRDSWTGSILLSWLAFEGIRWVSENLGPDHVLYPSLIDQPLINEYLLKTWNVPSDSFLDSPKDIASFPNKFLFVAPMNHAESIADEIRNHIRSAWKDLYMRVCEDSLSILGSFISSEEEKNNVKQIFERQCSEFWDFQWAASCFLSINDLDEIRSLLPQKAYSNPFKIAGHFNRIIEGIKKDFEYDKSGMGVLYSTGHSLVQSCLAAAKNRKTVIRKQENGEKCHLCGEFEVVHNKQYKGDISAGEYKSITKEFWQVLKNKWDRDDAPDPAYNLNDNEKLCSICLTKRMACESLENYRDHILNRVFKGNRTFPSTTEVAMTSFFERGEVPENERKKRAQQVHDKPDEKSDSRDRYYAILLMDGDKMGKLINGETIASTWKSVMHPDIVSRLEDPTFDQIYHKQWKELFDNNVSRLVTPAIHASISEALGDFSLYGVSSIIKKYKGRLIYAGGDDVCAVLPVTTSLNAAWEIQRYYTSTFKLIPKDRKNNIITDVSDSFKPAPGKLSVNLGIGKDISISAAILICHHKESLSGMLVEAQRLLNEKAKKESGRNACAIELRKRSGGSRYFVRQWGDETIWDSFKKIGDAVKGTAVEKEQVSTSLVYRFEQLRSGVEAILMTENWKEKKMLHKLIGMQLDRSSVGDAVNKELFADIITDLVVTKDLNGNNRFSPEGLIVAAFMAEGGE